MGGTLLEKVEETPAGIDARRINKYTQTFVFNQLKRTVNHGVN